MPLQVFYSIIGLIFYKDRRIGERIPQYFPSYRSFLGEFLNQLLRLLNLPWSYLPQGIIIEPTNICNLKCRHCTAQSINEKRGKMSFGFYKNIIDANPQLTCLILSRNGESLLNPDIYDMVKYAKDRNIYVSIYTNGILMNRDAADRLIYAGIDEIIFSLEDVKEGYENNRNAKYAEFKKNIEYVLAVKPLKRPFLKIGLNVARISGDSEACIKRIREGWGAKVDHIDVEPLMGSRSAKRKIPCRTLWRNAVVRWDGVVLPCCIDMKSTLIMGDLNKNTLREIFNGEKALALRKSHLEKKYPPVCEYCDLLFG